MKTKTTQWRLCLSIIAMHVLATASIMAQSYTLTDNDVVVVDGVIESCSYNFAIKDIIIPDMLDGQEVIGIASIDEYQSDAFGVFYNKGIVALTLPSTLMFIGNYAFFKNSLTVLDLSNCTVLTSIRGRAFCRNELTNLNLSNSTALTFIGESAFSLNSLTNFTLPTPAYNGFEEWIDGDDNNYAANTEVSDFFTSYSAKIPTYTLTNDDVEVVDGMITSCTYNFVSKFITIPNTLDEQQVTGIANGDGYTSGVFCAKDIREVSLPSTFTSIGNYAFYDNSLTSLDLSNCTALTAIGNYTFFDNFLTSLDFSGCASLLVIKEYAFFSNSLTNLDLTACSNLTSIGNDAFFSNSLTALDLSACISLSSIGRNAFYSNSLTSINFSGCASLTSIGSGAFSSNLLTSLNLSGCSALTSIGRSSFDSNSLTSINFSGCTGLTFIGGYALYGNPLTSFTLPTPVYNGFVEWIDGNDNSYAANTEVSDFLTPYTAILPAYTLTSDDVEVVNGMITSCSYNFASRFIIIPNTLDGQQVTGIASVDDYFSGVFYAKGIKELTLPSSLVTIGDNAFGFNSLASLDFSACTSLTSIGSTVFRDNFLSSLNFDGCISLTSIGKGAFYRNSLTSFTLPTPAYDSFVEWIDGNNNRYAANTEVSDLSTSYTALLASGIPHVNALDVALYPNPATSKVTVASEQGDLIEVYSALGRKVMSQTATSNAEVLTIEYLQSGTYIVKVGYQWGKLIVE